MRVSDSQLSSSLSMFVLSIFSHWKVRFSTAGCSGLWPLSNRHLSLSSCHEGLYILSPVNLLLLLPVSGRAVSNGEMKKEKSTSEMECGHSECHSYSTPHSQSASPRPLRSNRCLSLHIRRKKNPPAIHFIFYYCQKRGPATWIYGVYSNAGWITAARENIIYC